MNDDLLRGNLVRLTMDEPEVLAKAFAGWQRDSEYWRLLASDPSRPNSVKATQDWLEKELFKDPPDFHMFTIRRLDDDRLIGEIGLDGIDLPHGDTFIGIGLGERDSWGRGYGSDAMRIILRFAFTELNLRRVSLDVFEYNPRAIASYRKVGFVEEGRLRRFLHRDGRRWDLIFMGLLREEWEIHRGEYSER
jgi:RimJ/RimL family protein N-acetyltransferase